MTIITKSDMQKNIGSLAGKAFTVVNRGKPEMYILPFFEGSEELIEDYLEDYEMMMNKDKLQKELQESLDSGESDFSI